MQVDGVKLYDMLDRLWNKQLDEQRGQVWAMLTDLLEMVWNEAMTKEERQDYQHRSAARLRSGQDYTPLQES